MLINWPHTTFNHKPPIFSKVERYKLVCVKNYYGYFLNSKNYDQSSREQLFVTKREYLKQLQVNQTIFDVLGPAQFAPDILLDEYFKLDTWSVM